MGIIEKAINFAAKAHDGQTRKGTDIPYISHPFAVGMMLHKAECTDEVIAAGILHDTLEDTSTTYDDLKSQFGDRVAELVLAASEQDKNLPWKERKQHTINQLKDAELEEIQIITADKLHNLKSIKADIDLVGEEVWKRFNRGKFDQCWYYTGIVKALTPRKKEFKLIKELEKEVKDVFGTLHIFTNAEIDILFSCTYGIYDNQKKVLQEHRLYNIAEELLCDADCIYRNEYETIIEKLRDLTSRGTEFQTNSEGPYLIAAFCVALQKKMNWSDEEIFKHFKRNLKRIN